MRLFALRLLVLAAVAAIAVAVLHGKPTRPTDPPKMPETVPKIPDVSGQSNWGMVSQAGRTLTVFGSSTWEAPTGELLEDGRVVLRWWNITEQRPAIGLYKLVGRDFVGHWGWDNEVEIGDDGELVGSKNVETIYKTTAGK